MIRYNQGFGNFGPMEQCNDGKWCKFDDAQHELATTNKLLKIYQDRYADLDNENKNNYICISKQQHRINSLELIVLYLCSSLLITTGVILYLV